MNPNKMKTQQIAIIAVVVVIVGVGGYWFYQQQQTQARLDERRARWETWSKTLKVGTGPSGLHPAIYIQGGGDADRLHMGLLATRPLTPAQEGFKPGLGFYNNFLVESWELKQSPEGQPYIEYIFKPGLKFSDGTPCDANAVKFSWEEQRYDLPFRETNGYTGYKWWHENAWERLEVPDDEGLILHEYLPPKNPDQPYGGFLPMVFCATYSFTSGYVHSPTAAELYVTEDSSLEDCAKDSGYGPFLLDKYVPDERYEYIPNPDFLVNPDGPYAGPSKVEHLDRVITTVYPDPSSLRMAIESGEVDMSAGIRSIGRADFDDLKDQPGITAHFAEYMGPQDNLHFNRRPEYAPMNDSRVRRAIALAIDVYEIDEKIMYNTGEIAHSSVRPVQAYYKPVYEAMRQRPLEERIEEAKQLLAEAGYPDGFAFELWYPSGSGAEFNRELGTVIQSQLAKIGIELELVLIERGTYFPLRAEGKCPLFFRGWTHDYPDADSELYYQMHSSSSYLTQPLGFKNKRIDYLLDRERELYDPRGPEYDPPERGEILEEIQDWMYDNTFNVPLYYDHFFDVSRDWVKGYRYWKTCDMPYQGLWPISKEIPDDWETREPPWTE
jgi:peptide/nickel transport system substrate-binding protein